MNELKYFILGFLFIYAVQILDEIMQVIGSYFSIIVSKCNVKINELGENAEEQYDDSYRIGFHVESMDDEFELDGDYID